MNARATPGATVGVDRQVVKMVLTAVAIPFAALRAGLSRRLFSLARVGAVATT
jgi:hypothetical protein